MELFFDTETTGLCYWNLPHDDPCQPDVIQLAAVLATEEGEIAHLSTLINPPWQWSMSPETGANRGGGHPHPRGDGKIHRPDVSS